MDNSTTILAGKRAVVFGAAGAVGTALAREFASQGADVYLSGRTESKVKDLANDIDPTGKRAHAAEVDAVDEGAVNAYLDAVVNAAGGIDIVVNTVALRVQEYGGGRRAVDLGVAQYMAPLTTMAKSQFITATAAARHMRRQGSGVLLFVTGSPARPHTGGAIAIGAVYGAVENLTRHLAIELGPDGIRPVCLRSSAMPDTRTIQDVMQAIATRTNCTLEEAEKVIASATMRHVAPLSTDTAKLAAFLVSDQARTVTGTIVMSEIR